MGGPLRLHPFLAPLARRVRRVSLVRRAHPGLPDPPGQRGHLGNAGPKATSDHQASRACLAIPALSGRQDHLALRERLAPTESLDQQVRLGATGRLAH